MADILNKEKERKKNKKALYYLIWVLNNGRVQILFVRRTGSRRATWKNMLGRRKLEYRENNCKSNYKGWCN